MQGQHDASRDEVMLEFPMARAVGRRHKKQPKPTSLLLEGRSILGGNGESYSVSSTFFIRGG